MLGWLLLQDFPHCLTQGVLGSFATQSNICHNDQARHNAGFILRPLLLACSKPPSSCMFPWPLFGKYTERGEEGASTGVSFYNGIYPVGSGPAPITPLNPI